MNRSRPKLPKEKPISRQTTLQLTSQKLTILAMRKPTARCMAWEDRTTFDQIKERSGFSEADVIKLMRRELKPCSFRLWRKRVSGRITKHRKLFERHIKPSS